MNQIQVEKPWGVPKSSQRKTWEARMAYSKSLLEKTKRVSWALNTSELTSQSLHFNLGRGFTSPFPAMPKSKNEQPTMSQHLVPILPIYKNPSTLLWPCFTLGCGSSAVLACVLPKLWYCNPFILRLENKNQQKSPLSCSFFVSCLFVDFLLNWSLKVHLDYWHIPWNSTIVMYKGSWIHANILCQNASYAHSQLKHTLKKAL